MRIIDGVSTVSFADIVGHDRPLAILKRALANHTLAHAYLFSGEEGIGKKMTALALAAAVNCLAAGGNGGCECAACRKTASRNHPDVHILEADGDEIKIDQIREAQAVLSLKPFEGAKKILIVDGAESMNPAASNAFLKTLEEPPGDALIVLISSMPRSLLQTIRSRCQEIRFQPLPRRALAQVLARTRGLSESDASFLAALAQGSLGRGLAMDGEGEKAERNEVLALWSRVETMGPGEALAEAEALSKDRERLERLLEIGVEWLRDAVIYQITGDEGLLVHGYSRDVLGQWAERLSLPRMLANMERMSMSRNLLGRRVNAQLVAENLLLELSSGQRA
jgi:DNA polymerase-3 subunit delta'